MKTTTNILTAAILAMATLAAAGNAGLYADQPQSEQKAAGLQVDGDAPVAPVVIKLLVIKSGKASNKQALPDPRVNLHTKKAPAFTRFMRN